MRIGVALCLGLCSAAFCACTPEHGPPDRPSSGSPILLDQGAGWTDATRADFYSRDQGSQIMPLAWLGALEQPSGSPFLADSLGRYGYLANPANNNFLPVGFTAAGPEGSEIAGMTCAACHTRQISVGGSEYRIDGGPAIVDFQSFLADLDTAVGAVLASDAAFQAFARRVLGATAQPADVAALRQAVELWHLRYHTLMTRALPAEPWGPGRLDAVAMIFNRLTGLDLGKPPGYLIPENIQPAEAPVRYPFLWNAAVQDQTQWPGFADNGSPILGLARNLGEVYGVFATFHPRKDNWRILDVDYSSDNSANFEGLTKLEKLVRKLGPPRWPWPVDEAMAAAGKAIYERPATRGGCTECHGITKGAVRFPAHQTWATPVQNVGTDTREFELLGRTARSGALEGARIPFVTSPLKPTDTAFNILATSVLGSVIQHYLPFAATTQTPAPATAFKLPPQLSDLPGAFRAPAPAVAAYEARVLEGIWAAAPYLHNGSVPTLAELLKPAAERVAAFKIGPSYDLVNVGIAPEQTSFDQILTTTDCSDLSSGNSRCGHEFGTSLPQAEKQALLEYLKTL
jgi:mono/diheme cytochrome c family protein